MSLGSRRLHSRPRLSSLAALFFLLLTVAAAAPASCSLPGSNRSRVPFSHLLARVVHARWDDSILPGSGRTLLPVRGGARHLKRSRHVGVDREHVVFRLCLRVQGRRVARGARNMINDLRSDPWRGWFLRLRGTFARRGRGLRARFRAEPEDRSQDGDKNENSFMEAGKFHRLPAKQAAANAEKERYPAAAEWQPRP